MLINPFETLKLIKKHKVYEQRKKCNFNLKKALVDIEIYISYAIYI